MRFQPKSEEQIQSERFPVLKPGKYNFEVFEAHEAISKKGNAMIVVKLKLLDQGLEHVGYVTDYLMESISHKLRHACYACGLGAAYDSGNVDAHQLVGRAGSLELGIQKDKTGQYPDKNSVMDYITVEKASGQSSQSNPSGWDDMGEPPEWVK